MIFQLESLTANKTKTSVTVIWALNTFKFAANKYLSIYSVQP